MRSMTTAPNRAGRRWYHAAFWFALSGCLSCDSGITDPIIDPNPDIREYLTPSIAAMLDASGRLPVDADARPDLETVPVIQASIARALAAGQLKTFGAFLNPTWEQDRGRHIDWAVLTVSPRVYVAQTVFGAVPDVGCHPSFVHWFGSFYMMTYDADGAPQVRIAVSAQATDYDVDNNGFVTYPPRSGNAFFDEGIVADNSVGFLLSPEQAIAIAAGATGAKVQSVPRLLMRGVSYTPNFALWRIDLDRAVTVRRVDGSTETTSVLYVGPNQTPRFYVASSDQPASVTRPCDRVDENNVHTGFVDVTVPVLNGQPTNFEPVTIL